MQHLSRKLALATAALAMTVPLASCGFDYATNRYYTPGVGANDRAGTVDVLAGVIVSTDPGAGTFVASLSNNSLEKPARFAELTGPEVQAAGFEPVTVPPGDLVNLAEPPARIKVTGDFEAGNFVTVTLGFAHGQATTLDVPVVANAGDYAGLDGKAPAPTEAPTSEPDTESESHSSH